MKPDEKEIARVVRVEVDNSAGEVYIVFRVTDPAYKKKILQEWVEDVEFKLKDKTLIKE